MKTLQALLICLIFSISALQLIAQESQKLFSKEELRADFDLLQENFETVHAGLYLYTTKSSLDSTFASIRASIDGSMSEIEFYRLLLPLLNQIRNGHTMILPSVEWDRYKSEEAKLFPIDIYWADGEMYVLKNLSPNLHVKEGHKILTINGELASNLFNRMVELWTKDGYNTTFPEYIVMKEFSACYANFIGLPESYELELEDADGVAYQVHLSARFEKEILASHKEKFNVARIPWYLEETSPKLTIKIEGTTAFLSVPTFDQNIRGDNGMKFKKYYNYVFEKLEEEGIQNLVIDVRENGGGDPQPVIALYSHLTEEPFKVSRKSHTITRKIPNPKLYEENIWYWNIMAALSLKKNGDNFQVRGLIPRLMGDEKKGLNQPSKTVFKGNVYALVGGRSFSATGEFAGLLKYHEIGTLVGEETGGNPSKLVAGVSPHLILPNSGIKIRMNLIYDEMEVEMENDGIGVIPDHTVRNSIEEEIEGEDAVMSYTKQLIMSNQIVKN